MKPLRRPLASQQRELRPVQLVKLTQSSNRVAGSALLSPGTPFIPGDPGVPELLDPVSLSPTGSRGTMTIVPNANFAGPTWVTVPDLEWRVTNTSGSSDVARFVFTFLAQESWVDTGSLAVSVSVRWVSGGTFGPAGPTIYLFGPGWEVSERWFPANLTEGGPAVTTVLPLSDFTVESGTPDYTQVDRVELDMGIAEPGNTSAWATDLIFTDSGIAPTPATPGSPPIYNTPTQVVSTGSDVSGWVNESNAGVTYAASLYDIDPIGAGDWAISMPPAATDFRLTGALVVEAIATGPSNGTLRITMGDAVPGSPNVKEWFWDFDLTSFIAGQNLFAVCNLSLSAITGGDFDYDPATTQQIRFDLIGVVGTADTLQLADPMNYTDDAFEQRVFYFADRPIAYRYREASPQQFDGRVQSVSVLASGMSHIPDPGRGDSLRQTMTLDLINQPDTDGLSLGDKLTDGWPMTWADIEISQLLLDRGMGLDEIAALPADSHEVFFRGVVRVVEDETLDSIRIVADTSLDPADRDWLGDILTDTLPDQPDPLDIGKRFDTPLGIARDMPLLGIDVPGYSVLAEVVTAKQDSIRLANSTRFGSSGFILIADEVCSFAANDTATGLLSGLLRGTSFGDGLTVTATQHLGGETVIELGAAADTIFQWGGITEAALLGNLHVRNGIADDILVPAQDSSWTALPNATAVTINANLLRQQLQFLVTQGKALTQQPSTADLDAGVTSLDEVYSSHLLYGFSGGLGAPSKNGLALSDQPGVEDPRATTLRIGNTDNTSLTYGGSLGIEMQFPTKPGNTTDMTTGIIEFYWDGTIPDNIPADPPSMRDPLVAVYTGRKFTGGASPGAGEVRFLGSIDRLSAPTGPRWVRFFLPPDSSGGDTIPVGGNWITLEWYDPGGVVGDSEDNWADVYQARRLIEYLNTNAGGNDIMTEAAAAVSVGLGLRMYADAFMYVKTQADEDASEYPLTAVGDAVISLPDVLRFLLKVKLSVDTRPVSAGGQLDDTTWDIADAQLALSRVNGTLGALGERPEDALARLCWEFGCQLARTEIVSGTVWRLLVAEIGELDGYTFVWPSPVRTISEYSGISMNGVDANAVFNTDIAVHYDFHLPREIGDIEGFRGALSDDDLLGNDGSRLRVGRRSVDGLFGFLNTNDRDTALRTGRYYAQEGGRDRARVLTVSGVPWIEAYDLELGDVVLLDAPQWSADGPGRMFLPIGNTAAFGSGLSQPDPLGRFGYVASMDGTEATWEYVTAFDLSFVERLLCEFQIVGNWTRTQVTVQLADSSAYTDMLEFDIVVANTPGLWQSAVFTIASPTQTVGTPNVANLSHIRLVPGGSINTVDDRLLVAWLRYDGEQHYKCRVVGYSKAWGLRGDMADLTLVEVT